MTTTFTARAIEQDLQAHIEDSKEFWITRNGKPTKRVWRELTATERKQVQEAERRAAYVVEFGIY